jgi:hypothetical protein
MISGDNVLCLHYPGCDLFIEDITHLYDLFSASLDDVIMKLDKVEVKNPGLISHIEKTQIIEFEIIGYRDLDTFSRSCVLLKFEKYSTSLTLSDSSNSLFLGMKPEIDHFIRKKQRILGTSRAVWSAWCIGLALMSVIPTVINALNPFFGKIITISGIFLTAVALYNIWVNYTGYNQIFLLHRSQIPIFFEKHPDHELKISKKDRPGS